MKNRGTRRVETLPANHLKRKRDRYRDSRGRCTQERREGAVMSMTGEERMKKDQEVPMLPQENLQRQHRNTSHPTDSDRNKRGVVDGLGGDAESVLYSIITLLHWKH